MAGLKRGPQRSSCCRAYRASIPMNQVSNWPFQRSHGEAAVVSRDAFVSRNGDHFRSDAKRDRACGISALHPVPRRRSMAKAWLEEQARMASSGGLNVPVCWSSHVTVRCRCDDAELTSWSQLDLCNMHKAANQASSGRLDVNELTRSFTYHVEPAWCGRLSRKI